MCRAESLAAHEHRGLPLNQLAKHLNSAGIPFDVRQVQILFACGVEPFVSKPAYPVVEVVAGDLSLDRFDLAMQVQPAELGEFDVTVTYARELFEEATIVRLLEHWQVLLQAALNNPDESIDKLALLSAQERHQVLYEFNATDRPYPREATIHELFEAQVTAPLRTSPSPGITRHALTPSLTRS